MGTIGDDFFRGTQGMRNATNAAAVSAISDTPLRDGELVYVATFRSFFALRKGSSDTVDGKTILATLSGTGRWERLDIPHPSWLRQATWFIDPAGGNDENSGIDSTHALQTEAERQRRFGQVAYLKNSVTVTIMASLPASDPWNGEIRLLAGGKYVRTSTPTTTRTSTLTAVTAINRASKQALHVTDGSFAWGASVGSQLVITSGARAGMKTFISKAISAGVARIGPGLIPPTFEYDLAVQVTPAVADPYEIRTLPDLYVGDVKIVNANDVAAGSTANTLLVQDIRLRGDSLIKGIVETRGIAGNFNGCTFDTITIIGDGSCSETSCKWVNSKINGGFVAGGVVVSAGLLCAGANTTFIDYDCMGQDGPVASVFNGALVQIANACAFDGTSGVYVGTLGRCVIQHVGAASGASLWGLTASGRGIEVRPTAAYVFSVAAAITINSGLGLGREALIGVTDKLLTQLPYVDTTTQAIAVNT